MNDLFEGCPRQSRESTSDGRREAPAPFLAAGIGSKEERRLSLDPERTKNGLVALVLAIVELLRQVLLRQALKRVESGGLSEAQTERLGMAMMRLEETMDELKRHFGLTDDDLNLDLGPLGKLF